MEVQGKGLNPQSQITNHESPMMKALYFDGKLTLREVPVPNRAPGEALIKIMLAGICGTDREILKGYSDFRGIPGQWSATTRGGSAAGW